MLMNYECHRVLVTTKNIPVVENGIHVGDRHVETFVESNSERPNMNRRVVDHPNDVPRVKNGLGC